MPTVLLKESIDVLLPFITVMKNASLQTDYMPLMQKHATVTLLLKNLDSI